MGTSINKIAAIAATTSLIWPTVASPQAGGGTTAAPVAQASGGAQIDIGVSTSLKYDNNFRLSPGNPGAATFSDTALRFGVTSDTGVQRFSLTGSGTLRFGNIPNRSLAGFEDPNFALSYLYSVPDSRISVNARYRKVDREFLDPFQVEREEQNFGTLVGGGGKRESKSISLGFTTGINDPISYSVNASHSDINYLNVINPNLSNSRDNSISGSVGFRLSPVTSLSLNLGRAWYDSDNATRTHRVTDDLSVGFTGSVNPALTVSAQLGFTQVETDKLGVITNNSGLTGNFNIRQQVPTGDYSAQFSLTRNQNGARSNFTVGRSIQFPTATLNANVGLTQSDSGKIGTIANISWSRQLKSSNYGLTVSRSSTTNTNDQDILNTRVAANYGYDIDNNSRIIVSLDYGLSEDGGAGSAPTIKRANFRAAYSRALTQDWNLQGGFLLRYIDDSSATGSAQSNSVFLTLDRTFSFRP